MARVQEEEKKTVNDKVGGFLTKYGKIFVVIIVVLIVGAVVAGVINFASKKSAEKGYAKLDEITQEFAAARKDIAGEELTAKEAEIIEKALALANANKSNGVGARAYMLAADIDYQQKNWENAKNSWIAAAEANKKAYTAPLSYYNAAICCDELGDLDNAIKYFKLAGDNKEFALRPNALFNLGRVQEAAGKSEEAVISYNTLIDANPNDSYAQLAKSRVIAIEAKK